MSWFLSWSLKKNALLTAEGVQPVRQVAIDETWSALRFRPA
jgi:hypothetical protein